MEVESLTASNSKMGKHFDTKTLRDEFYTFAIVKNMADFKKLLDSSYALQKCLIYKENCQKVEFLCNAL